MDGNTGLVKVYWEDIRKRVAKVEPRFAAIVDEISPDKSFPLYLAYYPYGVLVGDTISPFIPKSDGTYYRLSDPNAPKDVIKHLGYGKNSAPLGMLLDKTLEIFIDLKEEGIAIPWSICSPGNIVSYIRNLGQKNNRIYTPNGVLTASSGTRSAFMLPHIGSTSQHSNLQRDFNIQTPPPKNLYEHWALFKGIIGSGIVPCDWKSCLMYFSEKWVEKLNRDGGWARLKAYLYEFAWNSLEYNRNRILFDIVFSVIQKKRNLKPNPYLADTARHLFATALGAAPGYAPACNNEAIPVDILQKVFVDCYGLKKYFPTILQPTYFNFENGKYPVYYSLQYPSTFVFSPKSRKISSTLFEMRELEHIMRVFSQELSKDNSMCADIALYNVSKQVEFKYFHNEVDRHRIIQLSSDIGKIDSRFNMAVYNAQDAKYSSDARFVRGCIGINIKNDSSNI